LTKSLLEIYQAIDQATKDKQKAYDASEKVKNPSKTSLDIGVLIGLRLALEIIERHTGCKDIIPITEGVKKGGINTLPPFSSRPKIGCLGKKVKNIEIKELKE